MNRNSAPTIQMDPADHRRTLSWGSKPEAIKYQQYQAKLVREGNTNEAFQREYQDIKEAFPTQGGQPGKYDQALDEMIDDALERGFLKEDFRTKVTKTVGTLAHSPNAYVFAA